MCIQPFLLQDGGTVSGALTVLRVGREEYARQGNGLDQILHRGSNAARCPKMTGRATMNRHQRRLRAKAKPVRLPPPGSDDHKVLRVLLTQMPLIQQFAALEQIDVLEAADGMIELIEKGLFRLLVRPDGEYELVETAREDL
jgi:hypothetical protein